MFDEEQRMVRAMALADAAYDDVERGDLKAAKSKLEESLSLNGGVPGAHNEYALVLTKLGQVKPARRYIETAITLSPQDPKYWMSLAMLDFMARDFESATRSVLMAESINPKYPTVAVAKMNILNARGGPPEEVAALAQQAREFYNRCRRRADGTPLKMGDVESYLNIRPWHQPRQSLFSRAAAWLSKRTGRKK